MAVEKRRGCGFRKVGGLYLVSKGVGLPCDRLPFLLTVCPTCSHGIKQARGWTWVNVDSLVQGVHRNCKDDFPCPLCMAPGEMGRAGLLWIGERFYPTPQHFIAEAQEMGLSRRIKAIPRGFKLGETWVLMAHPKTVVCHDCKGLKVATSEDPECGTCASKGILPGIFRVFRPEAVEKIITESQSKDSSFMRYLEKQGITPVVVPDDDKDHQGSVYDKDEEDGE